MVLNTTYHNKEQLLLIDDLIGKQFSFFEKLRKGGIGSKRLMIKEVKLGSTYKQTTTQDLKYASIELRPSGIVVHVKQAHDSYAWAIPYYKLVIYKTSGLSIHADGKFIQFRNNKLLKENRKFFNTLLDEKVKFDAHFFNPSMP